MVKQFNKKNIAAKLKSQNVTREGPCVGGSVHMCRLCACETVHLESTGQMVTSALAECCFFFLVVKPLSQIESVLVSILIKVDSFNLPDCLLCISRVFLSYPHHLFLFDSGEPWEIRAVTFSAAFSASSFFCLPVRLQSSASQIIT